MHWTIEWCVDHFILDKIEMDKSSKKNAEKKEDIANWQIAKQIFIISLNGFVNEGNVNDNEI